MRVIPAIITSDRHDLAVKLEKAMKFTDTVQIDFFDGLFVPGYSSLPPREAASFSTKLDLIAHVLAFRPEQFISGAQDFERFIFHLSATDSPRRVIDLAKTAGLKVGVGIIPSDDLGQLDQLAVDEVLFLAVDPKRPGVFQPPTLEKIKNWRHDWELSRNSGQLPLLSIDGGISPENIRAVAEAGVDTAYVGHAIFGAGDPAENYDKLLGLIV